MQRLKSSVFAVWTLDKLFKGFKKMFFFILKAQSKVTDPPEVSGGWPPPPPLSVQLPEPLLAERLPSRFHSSPLPEDGQQSPGLWIYAPPNYLDKETKILLQNLVEFFFFFSTTFTTLYYFLQYDLPPLKLHPVGRPRAETRTRDGRSRGKDTNH